MQKIHSDFGKDRQRRLVDSFKLIFGHKRYRRKRQAWLRRGCGERAPCGGALDAPASSTSLPRFGYIHIPSHEMIATLEKPPRRAKSSGAVPAQIACEAYRHYRHGSLGDGREALCMSR
jgi:hypothetical protein